MTRQRRPRRRKVAPRGALRDEGQIRNFPPSSSSGGADKCSSMDQSIATALGDLVRRAQRGEPDAQRTLIINYQRRIAGFVYAITGRGDAVEDLSQLVFIK